MSLNEGIYGQCLTPHPPPHRPLNIFSHAHTSQRNCSSMVYLKASFVTTAVVVGGLLFGVMGDCFKRESHAVNGMCMEQQYEHLGGQGSLQCMANDASVRAGEMRSCRCHDTLSTIHGVNTNASVVARNTGVMLECLRLSHAFVVVLHHNP